jgi:hypothetical protein
MAGGAHRVSLLGLLGFVLCRSVVFGLAFGTFSFGPFSFGALLLYTLVVGASPLALLAFGALALRVEAVGLRIVGILTFRAKTLASVAMGVLVAPGARWPGWVGSSETGIRGTGRADAAARVNAAEPCLGPRA